MVTSVPRSKMTSYKVSVTHSWKTHQPVQFLCVTNKMRIRKNKNKKNNNNNNFKQADSQSAQQHTHFNFKEGRTKGGPLEYDLQEVHFSIFPTLACIPVKDSHYGLNDKHTKQQLVIICKIPNNGWLHPSSLPYLTVSRLSLADYHLHRCPSSQPYVSVNRYYLHIHPSSLSQLSVNTLSLRQTSFKPLLSVNRLPLTQTSIKSLLFKC